jgi:hypothetical protein
MGIADAIAITTMVIAKNFAMMPSFRVLPLGPYFMMYSGMQAAERDTLPLAFSRASP